MSRAGRAPTRAHAHIPVGAAPGRDEVFAPGDGSCCIAASKPWMRKVWR